MPSSKNVYSAYVRIGMEIKLHFHGSPPQNFGTQLTPNHHYSYGFPVVPKSMQYIFMCRFFCPFRLSVYVSACICLGMCQVKAIMESAKKWNIMIANGEIKFCRRMILLKGGQQQHQ